jgi:hypothetical protein
MRRLAAVTENDCQQQPSCSRSAGPQSSCQDLSIDKRMAETSTILQRGFLIKWK